MTNNTAIILLLLSVGLFYTFTSPQWSQVSDLRAQANQHEETLRNASAIIDLRDRLLVTYRDFPASDIERIERVLPDNADAVKLAYEIDGIASRHNITIEGVDTSERQDTGASSIMFSEGGSPTYEKASISFIFVANYLNFSNLLADLERSLRIMDVRDISFSVDEDTGLYEHRVTVDTYWLR